MLRKFVELPAIVAAIIGAVVSVSLSVVYLIPHHKLTLEIVSTSSLPMKVKGVDIYATSFRIKNDGNTSLKDVWSRLEFDGDVIDGNFRNYKDPTELVEGKIKGNSYEIPPFDLPRNDEKTFAVISSAPLKKDKDIIKIRNDEVKGDIYPSQKSTDTIGLLAGAFIIILFGGGILYAIGLWFSYSDLVKAFSMMDPETQKKINDKLSELEGRKAK